MSRLDQLNTKLSIARSCANIASADHNVGDTVYWRSEQDRLERKILALQVSMVDA